MNKSIEYYMNLPYRVEVVEDKTEGGYILQCPELKGCITCADTVEDGFEMINDAKREWFASCIEDDIKIPEPSNINDYSGQFKLRIPKSLHKLLADRACEEGISMNQYCLYLLSKGIS